MDSMFWLYYLILINPYRFMSGYLYFSNYFYTFILFIFYSSIIIIIFETVFFFFSKKLQRTDLEP